jgi:hypothetical protein
MQIAKDMIAIRIGPELLKIAVGAPSNFAERSQPQASPLCTNGILCREQTLTNGS